MNALTTISSTNGSYHDNGLTAVIAASDLADSTKQKYLRVVDLFIAQGGSLSNRDQIAEFSQTLSHSRRAQLKAAVRLWSDEMIEQTRSQATPENIDTINAMIHRFQALQTAVKVKAAKGEKVHTWLTRAEVQRLMDAAAGDGSQARRDRLALALLVGAGLRREEAAALTFADVKLQPIKGKIRTVLQVAGKGSKNRIVPISGKLAGLLDAWSAEGGGNGRVLRSVAKSGAIGEDLSAVALFQIVRSYGRIIDKPNLAPHDLRRTYAQIGYESGVSITQISKLLGHSSVATTQRYLNLDLDLETTISDFVPL